MPVKAYDLTGRTAFVTGAASGIGRSSALLLAEAGATVHCADRDDEGLDETAALIKAAGGEAHTHRLDVADREQVDRAVAQAAATATAAAPHGRLDIMAAIAGIMHSSPVLETRDEDLDRVLNINFKGVLYACQAAARAMIDAAATTATATPPATGTGTGTGISTRKGGSIITMASGAVDTGGPGLLCYGAAKAAVVQLTKTLATEVGPHGIRVNAVAPGWIRTPMTDHHDAKPHAHTGEVMARMSPLGRVGEPEDIAHAVLHLASDASAFTTGQILRPNGGVAMPW
ncbi:SDR family NAD(P)-dependent oxidoreductase [Streptomyces sp. NRRL S-920]|uniref:SDR family NAD(P)-dependent oxidoreductase n=1 Tax=Streptomyces sp. NRRL S-920 TaxID=1463921 RepID=UPI0004CC593B|nr:SDR family NAD(P)-dependent oxidoreductase [Streptomyces sp. NRRL S-920]